VNTQDVDSGRLQRRVRLCPRCEGKGHTADGLASLILFPLAFFERNDPKGFTRDPCELCNGTGFVKR
jgi:DnaJ-class molecular chaperone